MLSECITSYTVLNKPAQIPYRTWTHQLNAPCLQKRLLRALGASARLPVQRCCVRAPLRALNVAWARPPTSHGCHISHRCKGGHL